MQNQKKSTRQAIEQTKTRLDLLEELDLLESEFRLIENEYTKRRGHLENRLKELNLSA